MRRLRVWLADTIAYWVCARRHRGMGWQFTDGWVKCDTCGYEWLPGTEKRRMRPRGAPFTE